MDDNFSPTRQGCNFFQQRRSTYAWDTIIIGTEHLNA